METIEKIITPAKKVPTVSPSDSVASALENVKSSHDPVFVYDGKDFLGLVSGSHVFFKKRYPRNTKVSSALIMPPRLSKETSIYEAAKHMVATKTYTLPVFDKDEKIVGVISARSILSSIAKSPKIIKEIRDLLEIEKPVTATIQDRVRDVYSLLRKEKTSRIVVVEGDSGKMKGIITRRDLQQVFIAPPSKGKTNRTRNNRSYIIDDKDLKKFDFPVAEFTNIHVITAPVKSTLKSMLGTIHDKNVNSLILVDKNLVAKGIVSLRTFLDALAQAEPQTLAKINLSDKHSKLTEGEKLWVISELNKFLKKFEKHAKVNLTEATVNAYSNVKGKVTGFEFHLRLHLRNGEGFMTEVEDKVLMNAVREAIKKIAKQNKNSSAEKKKNNRRRS